MKSTTKEILRDLLRVGSSTSDSFEVRTGRIGYTGLEELYQLGLVGKTKSGKVYYPTLVTLIKAYV